MGFRCLPLSAKLLSMMAKDHSCFFSTMAKLPSVARFVEGLDSDVHSVAALTSLLTSCMFSRSLLFPTELAFFTSSLRKYNTITNHHLLVPFYIPSKIPLNQATYSHSQSSEKPSFEEICPRVSKSPTAASLDTTHN